MKTLTAFSINENNSQDPEMLHSFLDDQEKHALEFHLWKNGNEKRPEVFFSIAHNHRSVLLKFYVEEKEIRACVTQTNGAVWEDSCVEFFISPDGTGYYNFEFNCLGTVHAAFGESRNGRRLLPEQLLKKIGTHTRLTKKEDQYYWEILAAIPIEAFAFHSLQSLDGMIGKANFYKCGDGLSHPHYLSWSIIRVERPNFHLPEFFGEIRFE